MSFKKTLIFTAQQLYSIKFNLGTSPWCGSGSALDKLCDGGGSKKLQGYSPCWVNTPTASKRWRRPCVASVRLSLAMQGTVSLNYLYSKFSYSCPKSTSHGLSVWLFGSDVDAWKRETRKDHRLHQAATIPPPPTTLSGIYERKAEVCSGIRFVVNKKWPPQIIFYHSIAICAPTTIVVGEEVANSVPRLNRRRLSTKKQHIRRIVKN